MNYIADEINAVISGAYFKHYGTPRRSGRYPWGSGDNPYQNSLDFLGRVNKLRKEGFTYTDEDGKTWTGDNAIAKSIGLSIKEFRMEISLANDERKIYQTAQIKSMRDDGIGWTEIGRKMNLPESTVRSMIDEKATYRTKKARETAEFIKKQVDERGMIDVGKGVERELNISGTKLETALYILQKDGYELYSGGMDQVTNKGQRITQKVICPPGTPHSDIYKYDQVHSLHEYISRDNGQTFERKFTYPASLDSKRLQILYNEEGGVEKDGIVELRRGVDDLSLGESRYSQVRILVDDTHFIKGMAVYSDDLPPGVDVRFNTNKKIGTPMKDVLKPIKDDPDNPFGSLIKDAEQGGQYWYTDKNGEKKLGLINKRADEGDWSDWSDTLPSQFLGKQSKALIEKQLGLAKADKLAEYEEICSLTNPTVKKHLLQKFADECDSAAVQLKAAALPGQKYHVIIPINSLTDKEIYAPRYPDGTKLALIRYPHGGTFEIPIVTVNNKHPQAKKLLGTDVEDAVGINSKVAERLSGADFDGDTVMCIPTNDSKGRVKIISTDPLEGLVGFDPKTEYGSDKVTEDSDGGKHYYRNGREYRIMKNTNTQMGIISNLITDMTLIGAEPEELAAAVRHSMVVIDAEKHKLDYRASEIENNIAALHKKYQGHYDADGKYHSKGASTILSRSKGEVDVAKRKGSPKINQEGKPWYDPSKPIGAQVYTNDPDATYTITKTNKRTGETTVVTKTRTQKSTRMAETDDAYTLVSEGRNPKELLYADYANSMKALANQARKEYISTGKIVYSSSAKAAYQAEVMSLNEKLRIAELNATREREAQRRSNVKLSDKKEEYKLTTGDEMKPKDAKKMAQQYLTKYRDEVGSVSRSKRSIKITDREWEAIQAGAISEQKLKNILDNTDIADLRERAMPRATNSLSQAQVNRVKALAASNYTLSEIADKLGKSPSTISKILKEEK